MAAKKKLLYIFLFLVIVGQIDGVKSSSVHALSDAALRQRIEAQTRNDKRLAGAQVTVTVQDGKVVLYGVALLYSQKMRYERIAWRIQGVVEVDNEIRVVPRKSAPDEVIEAEIRRVILEHQRLQHAGISVTVTKGRVRLHGAFHNPGDALFLKRRIADIEGVIHIKIEVKFVT